VRHRDSAYAVHGPADDRLVDQYRDGCNDFTLDGSCINRFIVRRIDFIFGALAPVVASSRDLTCGIEDSTSFDPNCDDPDNPHRYSDHRLVWSLLGSESSG